MSNYMSTYISDFIEFLDAASEQLRMSEEILSKTNLELCDLEHYVEFGNPDASKRHTVYKRLRDTRIERRIAKENIEICTPVQEWIRDNAKAIRSIKQLLATMQRIEMMQSNRAYAIRTDILDGITDKTHLVGANDRSGDDSKK